MNEHRGELVDRLRVVLPKVLQLVLQVANSIAFPLELRYHERLLTLQASDEVRRGFGNLQRVLLQEEVSCCSKSRGERSVLRGSGKDVEM